ncbi:PilZ domain-containing protein [Thalassotalea eurytherma]|uniref:PilZ domain-containing protein n=1 Tax=Thalassotalea eurytherma TaxID=1144278 RepID=A0ABQ6H6R4_9GAMM|nr:PilZ domain-containing protein [Thalassotalea eurytherma]GLX82146.1 hypothetical protein theurythT_15980 [Thalassotalea eurytherma]
MVENDETNERRQHIRLDMEGELVELRWQHQAQEMEEQCICLDISRKGIKVSSINKIELYTPVEMNLTLQKDPPVYIKARVIRSVNRDANYEIALLFQD